MRAHLRLFTVALSLSLLAGAPSLALGQPLPAGMTKVTSVEGIDEYRLANGLQVLLIQDDSKPTTTVNVTYRVGSKHENYGETGMAHLLEHLLFKGSPEAQHGVGGVFQARPARQRQYRVGPHQLLCQFLRQ